LPCHLGEFGLSLGAFQDAVIETALPKFVGDLQSHFSSGDSVDPIRKSGSVGHIREMSAIQKKRE
jgi:hypothetical protein